MPKVTPTTYPSCELYDLVLEMNWLAVIQHAKEQPEDAAFEDGDSRETPLYLACQLDPTPSAIRALIKAYPEAVRQPRKNGDLPLHVACRYFASAEVLEVFLENAPSTIFWATKYRKTPFTALADADASRITTIQRIGRAAFQSQELSSHTEYMRCRLDSLVRTAASGLNLLDAFGRPLLLHVALDADALDSEMWENHNTVARLLLSVVDFESSLTKPDQSGRLPLHVAAGTGSPSSRRVSCNVLQLLLQRSPIAAETPDPSQGGRLALQIMTANPAYSWHEIESVFRGAPHTLTMRDPLTGLPPFALAATVSGRNTLDTSYNLLSSRPDVLATANGAVWGS